MELKIYQVDAFTKESFHGNPAAIVPLEAWLPAETMQNIALENNLAETAFFVPEGDGFGLRWFTPTVEMDLCGHATLATGFLIFDVLGMNEKLLKFQTKSGVLTVEKEGDRFILDFPARPATACETPAGLIEAIGKEPKEILRSRDYLLIYETEDDIRQIKPDFAELLKVPTHAVIITARGRDCDFVSRFFAPALGVPEDSVTGSAHCTLIPYWAERLGKTDLFARQISARGGELFCKLAGDRVKIGGNAALYLEGKIFVEGAYSDAAAQ